MSNSLKNLLIFLGGAVTGAAATYFIINMLKNKEQDYDFPDAFYVDSIDTDNFNKILEKHEELNKPDISLYAKALQDEGYIDYSKISEKEKNTKKGADDDLTEASPTEEPKEIRVVDEKYFDELSDDDYRFIGYSFFSDNVLADENNEKVSEEEMETSVGGEWELYFKNDPSCDSVYVVNDRLHVAYEILRDLRLYKDVVEERGG